MKRKIRAIVKRPNEPVGHKITLDNNLETFQKIVGGPIETVTFLAGVVCVANEEGIIRGLPENFTLHGVTIHGPVVIVGVWDEDFDDCPLNTETWKLFLREWGNDV